jgi:hypothetical protein
VTGASAKLQFRTGAPPADCATADSGTLIGEISLPTDWMNPASGGVKTLLGAWMGIAIAAGVVGHFRLKDTTDATCHMQGTVGMGSGDMSLDNTTLAIGQAFTVTTFTLTDANG